MLINGEPGQSIPATDRGFLYGDGVFDTVRIINHQLTLWPLHRQRLINACSQLAIPLALSELEHELHQLLSLTTANGIAKIIITRGSGGRGYQPPAICEPLRIVQYHELPAGYEQRKESGVRVKLCKQPLSSNHILGGIKHLGRLDQVLASRELSADFDEGLMATDSGQVIEGTKSNLFVVLDGKLLTPELSLAGVAGVMREYLLNCFLASNKAVGEATLTLEDLCNATELFLCNSVFGVWPIGELVHNTGTCKLQVGPITEQALKFQDNEFLAYE